MDVTEKLLFHFENLKPPSHGGSQAPREGWSGQKKRHRAPHAAHAGWPSCARTKLFQRTVRTLLPTTTPANHFVVITCCRVRFSTSHSRTRHTQSVTRARWRWPTQTHHNAHFIRRRPTAAYNHRRVCPTVARRRLGTQEVYKKLRTGTSD